MQRRFIKKADIALIAVILCVGAALLIWRFLPSNGKTEAVIYAGGEVYRRVTLDKSADMTITPDTDPKVVIKIKDGAVWFEDADCRDKLCVKSGKLTRPGDTAACLPAGVVRGLGEAARRPDREDMPMKARKTALLGILCAQAIALSFLENLIPSLPFLPPGAKPGFSNIVTMFTVLTLGLPQAMCITVFKVLFALMTRGATAFFMSLAGGVLSTLAMWAATKIKSDPFGLLGASIIAAVCHNAGQLAAAAVLTGTGAVLGYAPALLIFSLITGAVTGTVLRIVMPALEKQTRFIIKK